MSTHGRYKQVADHEPIQLEDAGTADAAGIMGDDTTENGGKHMTPVDEPPRYSPPRDIHTKKFSTPANGGPDDVSAVKIKDMNGKSNGVGPKEGEAGEGEKKEEVAPMVGTFQLFRFADKWDVILMIIGLICACTHGAALPLLMIVFGDMTDVFVNQGRSLLMMNQAMNGSSAGVDFNALNNGTGIDLFAQMKTFSIYFVIIAVVVLFVAYGQVTMWQLASTRQGLKLRVALFRAIMRQEISWFDLHEIGELNSRLTDDVNKVTEGTGDKIANFFQWISCFIVGLCIGFSYGWKLSLVILAFTPVLAVSAGIFTKVLTMFTAGELTAYAKAGAVAEEAFGAIRTVVAFGGQEKEFNRYTSNLAGAMNYGVKKSLISGGMMGSVFFVIFAVYAVAFWYGSKLVREDPDYGVGNMLIVFFSVLIGAFALGHAGPNLGSVGTARGAAYVVYQIIDTVPLIDSYSDEGQKPASISGNIEFRDVHFRYPSRDEVKVLDGLNIQVNVGQIVALVGASGCGKSTTVQLIQRFYDPEAGAILVDGTNIKDLNVNWLRQHIGLVSQEPILFGTTIAENIRYGREDVTQGEIENACKEANAHDFVSKLPKKYETLVGERGAQLSGGQKQRIAIARALVRNPKILLLDEATSALDTESEATVQSALDKASRGRTTIVIAHRLSTIKNADVIVSVKDGKVAEVGTHDELMAKEGIYHQLVTNQTRDDDDLEEKSYSSLTRTPSHRGAVSKGQLTKQSSIAAKSVDDKDEEKLPTPSMTRVLRLNAPEAIYIVMGCFCAIINGAVQPAFALIFAEILAIFAKPPDEQAEQALLFSMLFLAIGFVSFFSLLGQSYFFGKSGEALTMRVRSMAFKAIIGQDIAYFDDHKNSVGALTSRLATDASAVQGATGAHLGVMFQSLASVGTGLVIGFIFSWKLTLLIVAFVPFIAVGGLLQMRVLQGSTNDSKNALEEASKIATEAVENMRTVASLTKEETFVQKFKTNMEGPFKKVMRSSHFNGFAFSFTQALIFFAYAASFTLGAYLVEQGEVRMDDVFRVFFAIVFSAMAAGQASSMAPDFGKGQSAAGRLFALFDTVPLINSFSEEGQKPTSVEGNLTFEDVNFTYVTRAEVPVLQQLSFRVQRGQTVALVGASGCGKSTTVQLLERFYDPNGGKVMIDGMHFTSLNVQWLRAQIGLVSQEPILFDCSIRENIAYGDNTRDVPMDEIIAAARNANIHSFIESLPEGYETNCGDKGTQLSGGQKQRIAIARALIRNPKVLLLDEATSALDTESEKVVQEALDRARAGRTSVVIAHRLSTIQNADCILVIHNGKVAEEGTHSELIALKGFYYRLHKAQQKTK